MKISLVTGSRADLSVIQIVREALDAAGHQTDLINITPDDPPPTHAQGVCFELEQASSWVRFQIGQFRPDLIVVVGDRYEILGATCAAYIMGVPIAHIAGGDRTLGSADDAMRDAITMLSSIHFTTHRDATERVTKMVNPNCIVCESGSPALDRILALPAVSRERAFAPTGAKPSARNVLVVLHPATIQEGIDITDKVLMACRVLQTTLSNGLVSFFIASPNGDAGNQSIETQIEGFCRVGANRTYFRNLPPDQYISLLRHCDVMIGNSSSGVYEAPALGVRSIMVGKRQAGRPEIAWRYCNPETGTMVELMLAAFGERDRAPLVPRLVFGDGRACEKIVKTLAQVTDPQSLLRRL